MLNQVVLFITILGALGLLIWREYKTHSGQSKGRVLSVLLAKIILLGMIVWLTLLGWSADQLIEAFENVL